MVSRAKKIGVETAPPAGVVQALAAAIVSDDGVSWDDREWCASITNGAAMSPEGLKRLFQLGYLVAIGTPGRQAREPEHSGSLRSRTVF